MNEIKKGNEIELRVEKLAFGGRAVARVDGFVVFMDHALPGQTVRARITRKKRQYADAQVLEVIQQSPRYIEPFCPHFGTCGGCQWQDLPYQDQLHWKRIHVLESLQHLAGIREALVPPAVPSPHERFYRNKMEFTFSNRRWLTAEEIAAKDVQFGTTCALGLHVRGFFDKVFNLEHCFLESPQTPELVKEVRAWAAGSDLLPYSTRDHQGFWRFLVVREGKRTGQTLVHVLTAPHSKGAQVVDRMANDLLSKFPELTTFVHSVTGKKSQVAFGESSRIVFGPGTIEEQLGGIQFRISAHSFFQTNTDAAEKLYETILQFGDFSGKETVWDLYCGTGSIALFIASKVRRVLGFEVIQDAIDDAVINCSLNNITNCRFKAGDLKDAIRQEQSSSNPEDLPDVIITDPPRAGMHPKVVKTLHDLAPAKIITVSCNPATLARDLALLIDRYEVERIQPFDLFPHTAHIECVVSLKRRAAS